MSDLSNRIDFSSEYIFAILDLDQNAHSVFQQAREDLLDIPKSDFNVEIMNSNGIDISHGDFQSWELFAQVLDDIEAKQIKTVTLVVFDSRGDNIEINRIDEPTELFYLGSDKQLVGETVLGALNLKVTVRYDLRIKESLNVSLRPVITNGSSTLDFARFSLDMRVGDFVVLSPKTLPIEKMSPAQLLFPSISSATKYRSYILFCKGIKD